MATTLADFGRRLSSVVDGSASARIAAKAGMAAKEAAIDAASRDLGGDRAFSGFRRRVPLGAGFDDAGEGQVVVNFRPAGLWRLAESGRQRSGKIYPRAGARKGGRVVKGRALRTPRGFRASSSYSRSRGLGTVDDAVAEARREVPKAAAKQLSAEIRKVVR